MSEEGRDYAQIINWILTVAFMLFVLFLIFNGGIIIKEYYIVDVCRTDVKTIVKITGQKQFDEYIERLKDVPELCLIDDCELNVTGGFNNE